MPGNNPGAGCAEDRGTFPHPCAPVSTGHTLVGRGEQRPLELCWRLPPRGKDLAAPSLSSHLSVGPGVDPRLVALESRIILPSL